MNGTEMAADALIAKKKGKLALGIVLFPNETYRNWSIKRLNICSQNLKIFPSRYLLVQSEQWRHGNVKFVQS